MSSTKKWIIGIGGSEEDCVSFHFFVGTDEQVKQKLVDLVQEDREYEETEEMEEWVHGTEAVGEVEKRTLDKGGYAYHAYGCYENSHIDFSACPIEFVRYLQ